MGGRPIWGIERPWGGVRIRYTSQPYGNPVIHTAVDSAALRRRARQLPSTSLEEGGDPVQGVPEDGLERVAEPWIRHELGVSEQPHRLPKKLDPGERIGSRRTGEGPGT